MEEKMKEPKVVKWLEQVYGEEKYGFEKLPTGKYVDTHTLEEIEVENPVREPSRLAEYNVCPVGSIEVELACLENVKTKPYKDGCPEGYVAGDKIVGIDFKNPKTKKHIVIGIDEPEPMKLDIFEPIESENIEVSPVKQKVCIKKTYMPINKENVNVVIDSIVGTGAFQEFPYWYVDWGLYDHLADVRYHKGLDVVGEVYRVCYEEYKWKQCAYFKDKKTAEEYDMYMKDILNSEDEDIELELEFLWNEMKKEKTYLGYNYNDYGGEPCDEVKDYDNKKVLMCEIENENKNEVKLGWIK